MIDKILSVSTGNIKAEDIRHLAGQPHVAKFDAGFFTYTYLTSDNPASMWADFSEAFRNIMSLAVRLKCRFVCFDRDAELIPGLPSFEW